MNRRLLLHQKLTEIPGVKQVYFNSPGNVRMEYPCIRYSITGKNVKFASNGRYIVRDRYLITVIDKNPESQIVEFVDDLPFCSFDRNYTADGLSHFARTIFF